MFSWYIVVFMFNLKRLFSQTLGLNDVLFDCCSISIFKLEKPLHYHLELNTIVLYLIVLMILLLCMHCCNSCYYTVNFSPRACSASWITNSCSTCLHLHRKPSRSLCCSSSTTMTKGDCADITPSSAGMKGCGPNPDTKEANPKNFCFSLLVAVSGKNKYLITELDSTFPITVNNLSFLRHKKQKPLVCKPVCRYPVQNQNLSSINRPSSSSVYLSAPSARRSCCPCVLWRSWLCH